MISAGKWLIQGRNGLLVGFLILLWIYGFLERFGVYSWHVGQVKFNRNYAKSWKIANLS